MVAQCGEQQLPCFCFRFIFASVFVLWVLEVVVAGAWIKWLRPVEETLTWSFCDGHIQVSGSVKRLLVQLHAGATSSSCEKPYASQIGGKGESCGQVPVPVI